MVNTQGFNTPFASSAAVKKMLQEHRIGADERLKDFKFFNTGLNLRLDTDLLRNVHSQYKNKFLFLNAKLHDHSSLAAMLPKELVEKILRSDLKYV